MAVSEELRTESGRLATFDGPKQLPKRRASTTKKKTPTTASWPHKSPTPEQLAKAGLYYRPTSNSADSVTCFLCQKSLDGWDANDNPAVEHLKNIPTCAWAINVCIEQRSQDMDRAEEDPTSEKMVSARRATFQDFWPHEGKKGWKCQVKKMIDAGWCYNPIPEADDCVMCFYCGISLEGWEPKDDPWEEHRRRAPDCSFFSLAEDAKKLQTATRTKKGRALRTSKMARASVQSQQAIQLPEKNDQSLVDHSVAQEGNSVLTASKATRGRKKAAQPRTKRVPSTQVPSVLALAQAQAQASAPEAVDDSEVVGDESVMTVGTTTSKTGRGRSKIAKPRGGAKPAARTTRKKKDSVIDKSNMDATDLSENGDAEQSIQEHNLSIAQSKPKAKRGTKQNAEAGTEGADPHAEIQPPRTRKPQKKGPAKRTHMSEDASQLQRELEAETSVISTQAAARPKRGIKRISDGSVKQESSFAVQEELPPPRARAASRTTTATKTSPEEKAEQDGTADEQQLELSVADKQPKKQGKERKGTSDQSKPDDMAQEQSQASRPAEVEQPDQAQQPTPVASAHEAEEQVETPAKAPPMTQGQSQSPQSSDAENQPPSSRPSQRIGSCQQSKGAESRTPLAPKTPVASPSKRNVIAEDLMSMEPWEAVDLEKVFLASASTRGAGEDKENVGVEQVMDRLKSPEKNMTVEEWIVHNAKRAEERLRQECEGMIGKFESEGMKAIRAVEGIECV